MLRLWPERRALALFPDRVWLSAGRQLLCVPTQDGLAAADELLQRLPSSRWPRAPLDLLLSDEMARTVALPWQDGLRTSAQQLRYAEACLEDVGASGAGWTVQQGYRRYGRTGIAFAVRTDALQSLLTLAVGRRLRLRSVMPLAAAAYWRHQPTAAGGALMLVEEPRRFSALHFTRDGLAALEVQPVMQAESREIAARRLLLRMQVQGAEVGTITCWSWDDGQILQAAAADCYPPTPIINWTHGTLA